MCGILGVLGRLEPALYDELQQLHHRGPDQEGVLDLPEIPASLAHKRLSILGIEEGAQPIVDDQGRALVFNGEIYNCLELQREFELNESSRSDSLILFELLCRFGVEILPRLRGMFAFCFVDSRRKTGLLVRDPFGMKPLYFRKSGEFLEFASEVRSFAKKGQLCESGVLELLYTMHPSPGSSVFKGVEELLPGQYLFWENGKSEIQFFLSLSEILHWGANQSTGNDQDLAKQLKETSQRHLLSDVDVGLLLSGGLDSSSLLLGLHENSQKLDCFSLGFDDPEFDESSLASELANAVGYPFHRIPFEEIDLNKLDEILSKMDGPFADPSFLPTYLLCEGVSRTHKVVLGGDGGDEIFYGYPTFQAQAILAKLPGWIQSLLMSFGSITGKTSEGRIGFREKIYRLSFAQSENSLERHQAWMGTSHPRYFPEVVRSKMLAKLASQAESEGMDPEDPWDFVFYFYFRFYLASQVLIKSDRASMAHSLELRCPYLDVDFVRACFQKPNSTFPVLQKPKQELRKFYLNRLSKLRMNSPSLKKRGFSVPLQKVLPMIEELIRQRHGLDLTPYRKVYSTWPHFAYSCLIFLYHFPSDLVIKELKKHL